MAIEHSAVIDDLMALGMSSYEAKAYVALVVAGQPLSGYEVAKRSGVPRSTVYETLGKLVTRGAAFEARPSERGTDYVALPAGALIRRLKRVFATNVDALSGSLMKMVEPASHLTHALSGRQAVIGRAQDIIDGSRSELLVHAWEEEVTEVDEILKAAERRGVRVLLRIATQQVEYAEASIEDPDSHLLVVVGDKRAVVTAYGHGRSLSGVYSNDPAVSLLAVESIRQELVMELIRERIGHSVLADILSSLRLHGDTPKSGSLSIAARRALHGADAAEA